VQYWEAAIVKTTFIITIKELPKNYKYQLIRGASTEISFLSCQLSFSRHDNVQYLEKLKQLVLFIERNLEEKVDYHVL